MGGSQGEHSFMVFCSLWERKALLFQKSQISALLQAPHLEKLFHGWL